jgi:phage FluMu protein Com
MPTTIKCVSCQNTLRVREEWAGKQVKCPKCSATNTVPAPDAVVPAEEDVVEAEAIDERAVTEEPREMRREAPRRRPRRDDYDEDDDEDVPRRRIRRDDDAVSAIIPYRNPLALVAYYVGVFSLIPCLGLVLGPTALVLGILGVRYRNRHERAGGIGHAIAGIVLGTITAIGNIGGLIYFVVGINSK